MGCRVVSEAAMNRKKEIVISIGIELLILGSSPFKLAKFKPEITRFPVSTG
jgi:hypothetical protein